MAAPQPPLSSETCRMTCPHCQAEVQTKVEYETGRMTHIAALILFCCICWPCVCVPYCTDCAKDAVHTCPSCQKLIGVFKR